MQPINLEQELHNFQTQKYPTLQETILNNRKVLAKRKKFFIADLKQSVQLIEIVTIVIIYLRDLSFFKLFLRSIIHFTILSINPDYISKYYTNSYSSLVHTKTMIKMSFRGVLSINCFCFLMHLIFGVYSKSPSNSGQNGDEAIGYLYGGLTVQFMGERLPFCRVELMGLDLVVFGAQLVLLYLHGVVGNEEVFEEEEGEEMRENEGDGSRVDRPRSSAPRADGVSSQSSMEDIPLSELLSSNGHHEEEEDIHHGVIDKARIEGDGYNGNVELLTIDLFDGIRKMIKLKVIPSSGESSGLSTSSSTLPGAFPRVSSLV
ncbi:hypothetical protein I9W82_005294 [Candida metapsilosis]|uniref:DUF1746 domain-containing protein n=1 Tax=Candida metapsilosis TaxID=273372 RepID=A0A8H7Z9C6_9ASCO|nr:hypothetical protein I9W82_005294 [Candida metapsilosis]